MRSGELVFGLLLGANLSRPDLHYGYNRGVTSDGEELTFEVAGFGFIDKFELSNRRRELGKDLAAACGDEETKLPEGFKMPGTWPCRWECEKSWKRVRSAL